MELSATLPALLGQQAATYGSETILRAKDRGIWNSVSWLRLEDRVRSIGQGLRAAGLAANETVALLAGTRPEFAYADLAILSRGAVSVAMSPDAEPRDVGQILRDTAAAFAIVEGEEQLDKVLGVRADCPALRAIVIVDMKGLREFADPACISLDALIAGGDGQSDWKSVVAAVSPDQVAVVLITRDLAMISRTHAEIMRDVATLGASLGARAGDERLVVLPMSDPTERVPGLYLALKHRIVSDYLENPETATDNLREVKPTIFGADCEAWERLHARTTSLAANATVVQKAFYNWALAAGAGGGLMGALANLLVLPAVRAQLGFGRLRVAYVGDRAIPEEVARWAGALGIKVRHINPLQQGETHV